MKIYRARAIYGVERCSGGACVVFDQNKVVHAAPWSTNILNQYPNAQLVDLTGQTENQVLLPGLINVHTHLDMTGIGVNVPYPGSFIAWVKMFREQWQQRVDEIGENEALLEGYQRGWQMCREAGVLRVGDIARAGKNGTEIASDLGVCGVSFEELLGLPDSWKANTLQRMNNDTGESLPTQSLRRGWQPHAPYSTAPEIYERATNDAIKHGKPICTHVAETMEEAQFVANADGPFKAFYERFQVWDEVDTTAYTQGLDPVTWMRSHLNDTPYVLAHCNYLDEAMIEILAQTRATVAYCPRASAYFGHENHPYRKLMAAGVNVCLATDSSLCHTSLSLIDEMRLLAKRDSMTAEIMLPMITTNAANALKIQSDQACLKVGAAPGLIALGWGNVSNPNLEALPLIDQLLISDQAYQIRVLEEVGAFTT